MTNKEFLDAAALASVAALAKNLNNPQDIARKAYEIARARLQERNK